MSYVNYSLSKIARTFLLPLDSLPEGIVCQNANELHTIPSGFGKTALNFPININSLRECAAN